MHRHYVNPDGFKKLLRDKDRRASADNLVVLQAVVPKVRALGGKDSRLVEFIITDESIDRMSDSIKIDGWEVEDFLNNPVVLWAHSHSDQPVGKAVSLDVDRKQKQIRSITEFTPRDVNPFGYMTYRMYAERFLHAVSVGFHPKEYVWVTESTDAERARRGGIDFLKQSLLEYSAVPVPANPNALAVARSAGIDTAPLKQWAERVLDESTPAAKLTGDARRRVEAVRAAASPTGRPLIMELGDITVSMPDEEKGGVLLVDGQRVPLTRELIAKAVEAFMKEEIAKASGKVPSAPLVLMRQAVRNADARPRTIPLSEDELRSLITDAVKLTIQKALQRASGNVDGWM